MILSKIITFKCFLKYRYPGHLATVSKYRLLLKYQLFVKRVIYEHETWPSHVHHVKNYSDLLIFNQYVICSNLFTIILIFNNQQICRQSILTLVISQTRPRGGSILSVRLIHFSFQKEIESDPQTQIFQSLYLCNLV